MPNNSDSYKKCFEKLINEFTIYDQAVDVVSCWESIFKYGYKDELLYFDRFPNIPPNNLTPDFTVLFDDKYGIIFEIKRTFPKNDEAFKKEMRQLFSYDENLAFKADNSEKRIIPKVHDIVLVVSAMDSYQILSRLKKITNELKEFSFNNKIIVIEYFYQTNRTSRYVFRKLMGENGSFKDTSLPLERRLEHILGDKSEPFKCYPRHFMKYKINEIICNDRPPELYMAVFLWSKVFYNYLNREQQIDWRRGNTQKIQVINIDLNHLLIDLNTKYISQGNIRKGWIMDTIKFLEDAGLASMKSGDKVEINFRNLTQKIGYKKHEVKEEVEKEQIREFGHVSADL